MEPAMKKKVAIRFLITVCAGGRHAWFDSNVGIIRKPYKGDK